MQPVLLYRWKRSISVGTVPARLTRSHEWWHTDLMYLRVAHTWYFLVTVMDAYSRYVVHWELLTTMTATDVSLVIQEAVERTGATPWLVTDSGSQFTAAEFNEEQLHAALGYFTSGRVLLGRHRDAAAGMPAEAQSGTSGTTASEHGAAPTGRVMDPVKCIFGMELKRSECAETLHCPHRLNPSLLILSIRSC